MAIKLKSLYARPSDLDLIGIVKPFSVLLLQGLRCLDNGKQHCTAKNETLAELYHVSESTIVRSLAELEIAGLIKRSTVKRDGSVVTLRSIRVLDNPIEFNIWQQAKGVIKYINKSFSNGYGSDELDGVEERYFTDLFTLTDTTSDQVINYAKGLDKNKYTPKQVYQKIRDKFEPDDYTDRVLRKISESASSSSMDKPKYDNDKVPDDEALDTVPF